MKELFKFEWTGKLVSINEWHDIIIINTKHVITSSKKYKALKNQLTWLMQIDRCDTIYEIVDMIINVSRYKLADTGNIEKPIGDSLQQAGIIKNDNQIRHILILRDYHKKGEDDHLIVRLYDSKDNVFERKEFLC